MTNKLCMQILNILLFQTIAKWIFVFMLFLVAVAGESYRQGDFSKPTTYTYLTKNCKTIAETVECHR